LPELLRNSGIKSKRKNGNIISVEYFIAGDNTQFFQPGLGDSTHNNQVSRISNSISFSIGEIRTIVRCRETDSFVHHAECFSDIIRERIEIICDLDFSF